MLELNSVVENLMRDFPAHPDGILAGVKIKNGHVVPVGNIVFSASEFDVDGLVEGASFRANEILARAKVDQTVLAKIVFVIDLGEVISLA